MESDRGKMHRRQFFHLRFKCEAHAKECSRTVTVDGTESMETFMAIHDTEPMGGATICYLPNKDGKGCRIGVALCSDMDNFNKEEGRRQALEAIHQKQCAGLVLDHLDGDQEPAYMGADAEKKKKKHSKEIGRRKRYFWAIDSAEGRWEFNHLLTSDEAIEHGKNMLRQKARRVMERKLQDLQDFQKELNQRIEEERVRVKSYGEKCLSEDLEVKSKRRKWEKQKA